MADQGFVSLSEVEAVDLAICGDGLFQSPRKGLENVIVTSSNSRRVIVYLDGQHAMMYVHLSQDNASARNGLLWGTPDIEIDPTSQFDLSRTEAALGDLVFNGGPAIMAKSVDRHSEAEEVKLWPAGWASAKGLGFSRWRLIHVAGERRRLIFSHTSPVI